MSIVQKLLWSRVLAPFGFFSPGDRKRKECFASCFKQTIQVLFRCKYRQQPIKLRRFSSNVLSLSLCLKLNLLKIFSEEKLKAEVISHHILTSVHPNKQAD